MDGPRLSSASKPAIPEAGPSTSTSTVPSSRFRATPESPSRVAARLTNQRYPTPCTRPRTTNRARSMVPSALAATPPVPPHICEGDDDQDRNDDGHHLAGLAPHFGVQRAEQDVLLPADGPADQGQDRAPDP